ncbi:MAG: hypothetical protein GXY34_01065 [Syntrophomonadaceae bacterium]|nr:hypothetical protein [Syntrophomonadaceae bacterium]
MRKMGWKNKKAPTTYDLVRGYTGKSYSNELFAQVNDFFYEFGIIAPPKRDKDPE